MTIDILFWVFGVFFICIIGYLYFLAILSLMPQKKRRTFREPLTKFAVIIPAHNEASVIVSALESIRQLNYPKRLYETIVIADNCSDGTAKKAGEQGVSCVERNNKQEKGKGFALKWFFENLKKEKKFHLYDAFIILDADTIVETSFLMAMDQRVQKGERAIQGYYDVINPEASPMASLSHLGFFISRNLRFIGRTRIGWSNNLLGNGMCFSKEVINRFGWSATSIVEDVEYAAILQMNGIRVHFAPEAKIFAQIPSTFKGSKIQRSRWDVGKFQVRNKYMIALLKKAFKTRDPSYADMAMELLIPPFSIFVAFVFMLFALFMLIAFNNLTLLAVMWFAIVFALLAYVLAGLVLAKANWATYRNLMYSPFFLIWRIQTIIWGYVFQIGNQWLKTERK